MIESNFSFFGSTEADSFQPLQQAEPQTDSLQVAALNEDLLSFSKQHKLTPALDVNSTVLDVERVFNTRAIFERDIEKRRENAIHWKTALEMSIQELESHFLRLDSDGKPNIQGAEIDENNPLKSVAEIADSLHALLTIQVYTDVLSGDINHLHKYADIRVPSVTIVDAREDEENPDINHTGYIGSFLKSIAIGVTLAYKLIELKIELNSMEEGEGDEGAVMPPITNPRLTWKRSPSEFGYLIAELIGKGYMEAPGKSFKEAGRILYQLFDIKSDGKPTTPGTIAKEINPNSNSLSIESQNRIRIKA